MPRPHPGPRCRVEALDEADEPLAPRRSVLRRPVGAVFGTGGPNCEAWELIARRETSENAHTVDLLDAARRMCSTEAMTDSPREGLVRLTHIIYGLHAFSAVMGVISSAAVVTAFLTGWPSILAVILNYARREDVRGTYLDSHFRWQIRTFWFALLWVLVAIVLFITIVGIPLAWLVVVATGVWVLYRIGRGWLALNEGRDVGV